MVPFGDVTNTQGNDLLLSNHMEFISCYRIWVLCRYLVIVVSYMFVYEKNSVAMHRHSASVIKKEGAGDEDDD